MRCYFMRDGHICAVEVIDDAKSDDEAIQLGFGLLRDRLGKKQTIHGFEVWDRARLVHRHPPPPPKYTAAETDKPS